MDWLSAVFEGYKSYKGAQDGGASTEGGKVAGWIDASASGDMWTGAPIGTAPSYAGGGVWNVATSGSKASNSGSATTAQGVAAADSWQKYIPLGLGFLALVIAWKMLKTK